MALLTLAEYKNYSHITNNNADARLTQIILSAEKYFLNRVKRIIEQDTITDELYDGDNTNELVLKNYPIVSVTELQINDNIIDVDDYAIYNSEGIIKLKNSIFLRGIQNIKITYVAGFSAVPEDIKMAIAEVVSRKYEQFDKKGESFSSEAFLGGSLVMKESDFTDYFNSVLHFYRKKGPRNN
jgi:hypothetical protein